MKLKTTVHLHARDATARTGGCARATKMPRSRGHKGTGASFRDGVSKLERKLMRKGQLNAKERKIILMREERKAQQQQHSSSNAFSTEGAGAAAAAAKPVLDEEEVQLLKRLRAEGTRESRLAECALRGLSGVGIDEEQQLRRLARIHAEEAAAVAAEAAKPTSAAKEALAKLKADLSGS